MDSTSLRGIVERHSEKIIRLAREGKNHSEIARNLIFEENISLGDSKPDSLRREISVFLSFQDPKNPKSSKSIEESIQKKFEQEEIGGQDFTKAEQEEIEFAKSAYKKYKHSTAYYYDESKDLYIVYIKNKPYKFTGTIVRDMKSRYSNLDGSPETINEICRNFEIPRNIFIALKSIMGWTHDSEPFTDEEMISKGEDEMVSDAIQKRKFSFFQKYTREEEKIIKEAANNWWAFKGLVINPFAEKLEKIFAAYEVPKFTLPEGDPHALVISPFDLHYGKYAWAGEVREEYSRQIARDLLLEKTKELIQDILKYNIEKIIVPVGSDFFHVDTLGGTTTKGTPQDCDGTFIQIMVEGQQLMVEFIDILRQVSPVEIILTAGNHDFKLSHVLLQYLGAYYRECPDVNVVRCHRFRQYFRYGKNLMGFTHGDGTKLADLPYLMAHEASDLWSQTVHRAFFTGHLHHEMVKDYKGVKVFQMPSLSGSDRWHHNHGYEGSSRSLSAYVIHSSKGIKATLMANV
jgi:hypothetical protein